MHTSTLNRSTLLGIVFFMLCTAFTTVFFTEPQQAEAFAVNISSSSSDAAVRVCCYYNPEYRNYVISQTIDSRTCIELGGRVSNQFLFDLDDTSDPDDESGVVEAGETIEDATDITVITDLPSEYEVEIIWNDDRTRAVGIRITIELDDNLSVTYELTIGVDVTITQEDGMTFISIIPDSEIIQEILRDHLEWATIIDQLVFYGGEFHLQPGTSLINTNFCPSERCRRDQATSEVLEEHDNGVIVSGPISACPNAPNYIPFPDPTNTINERLPRSLETRRIQCHDCHGANTADNNTGCCIAANPRDPSTNYSICIGMSREAIKSGECERRGGLSHPQNNGYQGCIDTLENGGLYEDGKCEGPYKDPAKRVRGCCMPTGEFRGRVPVHTCGSATIVQGGPADGVCPRGTSREWPYNPVTGDGGIEECNYFLRESIQRGEVPNCNTRGDQGNTGDQGEAGPGGGDQSSSSGPVDCPTRFPDVERTHSYAKSVAWGGENGIVEGYTNEGGIFGGSRNITRAEALAMVLRPSIEAGDIVLVEGSAFSDTRGHWAESLIFTAAQHGKVRGYSDGSFKPNQTVTAAEAAKMAATAAGEIHHEDRWPWQYMDKSHFFIEALDSGQAVNRFQTLHMAHQARGAVEPNCDSSGEDSSSSNGGSPADLSIEITQSPSSTASIGDSLSYEFTLRNENNWPALSQGNQEVKFVIAHDPDLFTVQNIQDSNGVWPQGCSQFVTGYIACTFNEIAANAVETITITGELIDDSCGAYGGMDIETYIPIDWEDTNLGNDYQSTFTPIFCSTFNEGDDSESSDSNSSAPANCCVVTETTEPGEGEEMNTVKTHACVTVKDKTECKDKLLHNGKEVIYNLFIGDGSCADQLSKKGKCLKEGWYGAEPGRACCENTDTCTPMSIEDLSAGKCTGKPYNHPAGMGNCKYELLEGEQYKHQKFPQGHCAPVSSSSSTSSTGSSESSVASLASGNWCQSDFDTFVLNTNTNGFYVNLQTKQAPEDSWSATERSWQSSSAMNFSFTNNEHSIRYEWEDFLEDEDTQYMPSSGWIEVRLSDIAECSDSNSVSSEGDAVFTLISHELDPEFTDFAGDYWNTGLIFEGNCSNEPVYTNGTRFVTTECGDSYSYHYFNGMNDWSISDFWAPNSGGDVTQTGLTWVHGMTNDTVGMSVIYTGASSGTPSGNRNEVANPLRDILPTVRVCCYYDDYQQNYVVENYTFDNCNDGGMASDVILYDRYDTSVIGRDDRAGFIQESEWFPLQGTVMGNEYIIAPLSNLGITAELQENIGGEPELVISREGEHDQIISIGTDIERDGPFFNILNDNRFDDELREIVESLFVRGDGTIYAAQGALDNLPLSSDNPPGWPQCPEIPDNIYGT